MEMTAEKISDRTLLRLVNDRRELQLFTEREACELLGISSVTIWRERKARRINFRRIGGSIKYSASDLEAFIDRSLQPAIAA